MACRANGAVTVRVGYIGVSFPDFGRCQASAQPPRMFNEYTGAPSTDIQLCPKLVRLGPYKMERPDSLVTPVHAGGRNPDRVVRVATRASLLRSAASLSRHRRNIPGSPGRRKTSQHKRC